MFLRAFAKAAVLAGLGCLGPAAVAQLHVTFGAKGIQTISYAGTALEDVGVNPGDAFHIWHMQATDLQGNVLSKYGTTWGETNAGEIWNAAMDTETYSFAWGSIAVRFSIGGNNLDMLVTETNNADSGMIFDGAEIYPFLLHFPNDPVGFHGYSQILLTTNQPAVSVADFGTGVVTSVIPDASLTLYGGWKSQGNLGYSPVMTSTLPDNLAPFVPAANRPLMPGNQLSFTVSLRFTPEGTSASATDAYSSFASTYPSQMSWTDKRILGTAYLASSPASSGDVTQPGGFPTNPRRYFDDPSINIQTTAGLESFVASACR